MTLKSTTMANVVAGALLTAGASVWLASKGPFGGLFFLASGLTYLIGTVIVIMRINAHHAHARFGAANTITLIRFALVALFAGLAMNAALISDPLPPDVVWGFFGLAVLERVLDGVDGYFARRQRLESPFGSRFDMEVDALQILLLSIIAFQFDKAGTWVLIGGIMRYVFWGGGVVWPLLNQPLPASLRRKTVAVIQGSTLALLLMPMLVEPWSAIAAAIALTVLVYSFVVDTLWLIRSYPQTNL